MSKAGFFRRKQSKATEAVTTFESATAEVIAYRPWVERAMLYTLAAFVVTAIIFICVAKLDRVVSASGRVVPVSGIITVQPLEKSIINRILVAVGDRVKKGQVLATLDPTFVQATMVETKDKVANFGAQTRRMEAEEKGKPFRVNRSQVYDILQDSIREHRTNEYQAGVADFDQRISSSEALIAGYKQSIAEYREKLKIASQQETMYLGMEEIGVASHLQVITIQDQKHEAERLLAQAEGNLESTQHVAESLKQQREVYIKKWHDENLTDLVVAKDSLAQATDDFTKAKKMSELTSLVSPVDGIILKIPELSTGAVAMDAQPLFSLMPMDAQLEVDVQIESLDSGFVQVGDPVTIKFDTYRFLEYGVGEGTVKTITQDSFTESNTQDVVTGQGQSNGSQTREPYFGARIAITALKLHDVPGGEVHLMPGMTLQADIIAGRRTILWYLFSGALRSGKEAMREP